MLSKMTGIHGLTALDYRLAAYLCWDSFSLPSYHIAMYIHRGSGVGNLVNTRLNIDLFFS